MPKLSPNGPPKENEGRYCIPGYSNEDYGKLLKGLFGKAIPEPVPSRWNNGSISLITLEVTV